MPAKKPRSKEKTKKRLSARQRALLCADAAADKKAEEPVILGVSRLTSFADYFVIVSGRSTTQVKAIADSVEEAIYKSGSKPISIEGKTESKWILIDWNDVIVHIFHYQERQFYGLEKLWSDARYLRYPPASRTTDNTT